MHNLTAPLQQELHDLWTLASSDSVEMQRTPLFWIFRADDDDVTSRAVFTDNSITTTTINW